MSSTTLVQATIFHPLCSLQSLVCSHVSLGKQSHLGPRLSKFCSGALAHSLGPGVALGSLQSEPHGLAHLFPLFTLSPHQPLPKGS